MKILQVNSVYKKGSTGKIVYDIHNELKSEGIDSIVCYGRGEKCDDKNIYKICSELYSFINHLINKITGINYSNFYVSTNKLISIIKKENPDIVHLQCINGYFINISKIVRWLGKNNIKTVLTLHAEFMYTGGCGYALECEQWNSEKGCGFVTCPQWKKQTGSLFFDSTSIIWNNLRSAFKECNSSNLIIVSVSPWLKERAKKSTILKKFTHKVIYNGIDINIFHPYSKNEQNNIKKKYGIGRKKVIFHATAMFNDDPNHIKGGYYVIELAKKMKNFEFVVAGTFNITSKLPNNIKMIGNVCEQKDLAVLYSIADVTLLTSKRETFSMVTVESLCCGTPVVGFRAGAPEMIALNKYSDFVDYGNINKLEQSIIKTLNNKHCSHDISQKSIVYSKKIMAKKYINLYKTMMKGD